MNTVYDNEFVLIRSFTNAGNTTAMGTELNANLELGKKTKLFIGGSLYRLRVQADIFGYHEDNRSINWSVKGNMNVILTNELRMNADFDIKSAEVTAQGQNDMVYLANASLSYSPRILRNLTISFRGLNILNSLTRGLSTRAYDSNGVQIFYQDTEFIWYGPIAEVSISYSLNQNGQGGRKGDSVFGKDEF